MYNIDFTEGSFGQFFSPQNEEQAAPTKANLNSHRYCVVMCGGVGSRFWPYSRADVPKQFLDFFGTGRTLLQMTVDRLSNLIPKENIVVVTNDKYRPLVEQQLPDIKA
jgi:mannose-1-phosphate guanylyltransferase